MAIVECPRGHLYDPTINPSCPYCAGSANVIDFDQPDRTAAPAGYGAAQSAQNRTVPVGGGTGENRTVAPESYRRKAEEENKTVGSFQKKYDLDPVVGWLVCVAGSDKGKDYHLYAKINTIGRSSDNDVCIKGDSTVSRESHARLAYDPRHCAYQLIPGDSTNNIYLNDEPVYTPAKLEAYDLVELGQSKFLFIPLCGDKFKWETV